MALCDYNIGTRGFDKSRCVYNIGTRGFGKRLEETSQHIKHTQQHIKKHIHPSLVKQSWQLRESPVPATVAAEIQTS